MNRQKLPWPKKIKNAALIVVILPFILPLTLLAIPLFLLYRATLYLLVWTFWLPYGKKALFVYSDSPIWCEYMLNEVLPLVREHAVVLNWSERKKWPRWTLGPALLRHFGGGAEFNPSILLFRAGRRVKVFRFWEPFKAWKRGYKEPVERLRQELTTAL